MARTLRSSLRTLDERSLLAGVYAARLAVAYALAVAATVVRTTTVTEPSSTPLVLLIVGVPTIFTLASWIYGKSRQLSPRFLVAQVIHDLSLITIAVLLTGGVGSEFALFYILLVAAAGLLLGLRGAMVTAVTVVIVYLATAYWQISPQLGAESGVIVLPNISGHVTTILWSLALSVIVFLVVGVASGIVGRRMLAQRDRLMELEMQVARSPFDVENLLNTIESGVLSINDREEIDFINSTARMQLGIKGVPLGGTVPERTEKSGLATLYGVLLDTLRSEHEVEYTELSFSDEEGDSRTVGVTTTVLYDPRGGRRGAAAIVRDVENVKRLEELARQADRLRAVNELSAGLAHEIQNPLAAIRSAVELLGAGGSAGERDKSRLINLTIRETDRLTALIDDFKEFSGVRIRKLETVDVVTVVEDAIEVDRMAAGESGPRTIFVRPGAPHRIEGDHNLIKQVCLNLLSNARVAVNGVANPQVEVRVGGDAMLPELEGAGPFVALEVRDNGPGIDPEVRDRVFDPFFTTRQTGFGMGLAIVHRIVELHGGMVWADSDRGRGSRFRVALPRSS